MKTNRDRLVAAKLAYQDNAAEFFEQSLTRLKANGKSNDNIVQRVRKTFEAFEEHKTLCVEAENKVTHSDMELFSFCHLMSQSRLRLKRRTKSTVSEDGRKRGEGMLAH